MAESLSELQKWMHNALLRPEATVPAEAEDRLVPNPRLSAPGSLAIYQQSYALRIAACMREQFPALCHALGAELFNDFVAEYVREAPPESYTLYDLGRRFPGFLEANRPDRDAEERESWIDFVVDLSRFERAVFTRFDCPGAEDMDLATQDTPDADLRVNPSLLVGQFRFPVPWYYHEVRQGNSPSPPDPAICYVAIVRKDYLTTTVLLQADQYAFLEALCDQSRVDGALALIASTGSPPDTVRSPWAPDKPDLRNAWIRAGFFVTGP